MFNNNGYSYGCCRNHETPQQQWTWNRPRAINLRNGYDLPLDLSTKVSNQYCAINEQSSGIIQSRPGVLYPKPVRLIPSSTWIPSYFPAPKIIQQPTWSAYSAGTLNRHGNFGAFSPVIRAHQQQTAHINISHNTSILHQNNVTSDLSPTQLFNSSWPSLGAPSPTYISQSHGLGYQPYSNLIPSKRSSLETLMLDKTDLTNKRKGRKSSRPIARNSKESNMVVQEKERHCNDIFYTSQNSQSDEQKAEQDKPEMNYELASIIAYLKSDTKAEYEEHMKEIRARMSSAN